MNANVDHRVGLPDAPRHSQMRADGEWRQAESGERFTRVSPSHGVGVAETPLGGAGDADGAGVATRRAFEDGRLSIGGFKQSGVGKYRVEEYTQIKFTPIELGRRVRCVA